MNPLVYHIVSGQALFSGVLLILVAAATSLQTGPVWQRVRVLTLTTGLIAVTVSSTALAWGWYVAATVSTCIWIASRWRVGWRKWAAMVLAGAWLVLAGIEAPYHITPQLQPASARSLTVIGDSVTAGIGGDEQSRRWPQLLASQHGLQVQDISHMGETAASALKRLQGHRIESDVVLLEIGGNDLLGSTTPAQFEHDLDQLLTHVAAPGRQLMMFELPLPPFSHAWGRIQRQLAARYQVALVPRRVFLSVLAGGGATLDSIHLSQSGHEQMADTVWKLTHAAWPASPSR